MSAVPWQVWALVPAVAAAFGAVVWAALAYEPPDRAGDAYEDELP